MVLTEMAVNGRYENWVVVRIDITRNPADTAQILDWCSDKIRSFDWTWALDGFYFRNKKDAVLFTLRWL